MITWTMKMEHTIKAEIDGKVAEVRFEEGQFVDHGDLMVKLE